MNSHTDSACLKDSRREKLLNMFNALKRKQLDDRRSEDKEPSVFEETAEDYNTDSYAPVSIQLKHLHRKFAESMDLSLPDNAIPMTGEIAERMLKDFFSCFKKAFENWQASGNGKENKSNSGEKIRLLLKGTDYEQNELAKMSDNDTAIKYVDDDRYKFCDNNLAVAYLWGYLELINLTKFAVQNCRDIGLVSGKATSSARTVKKKKNRSSTRDSDLQALITDLPDMMQKSFASMMDADRKDKKLIQYEDQLRKATVLRNMW